VLPTTRWHADPDSVSEFVGSSDFDRFLGLYLRAMDEDPDEPAYPWNLAAALKRLGRPELALGFIGRAVRVGERLGDRDWAGPDEYLVWAETAIDAGQDEFALVAIAKALEQAPDDQETVEAAMRLLTALTENGRPLAHTPGIRQARVAGGAKSSVRGHGSRTDTRAMVDRLLDLAFAGRASA
jgi:tetratricopeptide (TPR) repeat protein